MPLDSNYLDGIIIAIPESTGRADGSDAVQVRCQDEYSSYRCAVLKSDISVEDGKNHKVGDSVRIIYHN